ncbi:MAG: phosphate ABC transporter permease PstA [Acidobacteria bacterium]|jgi:phosphate transport system permease protein|nr:phosphate ABC transporter permease PstA [Acidobacteriota bacterium]
MDRRKVEEGIFRVLMVLATGLILSSLVMILLTVLVKGLPYLSLEMVTQTPRGGYYLGKGGGILNAIIGSLYLAGGATLLAILFSLPVALYLNVYSRPDARFVSVCRLAFDVLNGVPSIVFGAFGFTLMIYFGLRASLLGGIIAIALLILPMLIRAMDEVIRLVPRELMDASYALGATRWETALRVVTRQALPGILTAVLIAFGRGIGDAAAVIFTAGFTDAVPTSLLRPAATLPLAIFFQLGVPVPEVQGRAYASALILTLLILIISVAARRLSRRLTRHVVK